MVQYYKPENALKRAEELIAVNQHASALTLLHETILSKRIRYTSLPITEGIVLKFLELCVLQGKGKLAKEGLYNYRNITMNNSTTAIEAVIKKFLSFAESRLAEAQAKADRINLDAVEDLEAAETPESILLSTVSSQDNKDRTDREHVTPWLRFLWEAYRTSLDTLRNNTNLENIYKEVANQAFQFCLKYKRKTEFKRLCEILRQHLSSVSKYAHQANAIDLNDPETLQRHLDIRFSQLNAAAELEHWQEGFKSIEDIYNLIEISDHAPKGYMMANFYEKLGRIFLVGDNYLCHASAVAKYYNLLVNGKKLSSEELTKYSSLVLVSALAIPNDDTKPHERLITLLGSGVPCRSELLKQALRKSVFTHVHPEFKQLYDILEVAFHPLSICKKIAPILAKMETTEFKGYVKPLRKVVLIRLFEQLSQVYSSVKVDFVVTLVAPYNFDSFAIEKFVMSQCSSGKLSAHINHTTGVISFSQKEKCIRSMASRVNTFAKQLESISLLLDTTQSKKAMEAIQEACKKAKSTLEQERLETYKRRHFIEKKREKRENDLIEREREEARIRQQKILKEQESEKQRLEEEAKRREELRLAQQRKTIERQEAVKFIEKMTKEFKEKNISFDKEAVDKLGLEALNRFYFETLEKERKELNERIKSLTKKTDHLERAYRKEEIPLLLADYEKQQVKDKEDYEIAKKLKLQESKQRYEQDILLKQNVLKFIDDYNALRNEWIQKEQSKYEELKKVADEKLAQEKQKREEEAIAKEKEEAERKAREEALRKEREEELAKKKKEDEERMAKLNEIAERQRQREMEIEQRLSKTSSQNAYRPPQRSSQDSIRSQDSQRSSQESVRTGPPKIFSNKTGGWRDRVKAKEEKK